MSAPTAFTVVEIILLLAGLVLLWKAVLSASARARSRHPALPAWDIQLMDFLLFLWAMFAGAFLVSAAVELLIRPYNPSDDDKLFILTAAMHAGIVLGIGIMLWVFPRVRTPRRPLDLGHALLSGLVTFLIALPLITGVTIAWQTLMTACGLPPEKQELMESLLKTHDPLRLAFMALVASLIAPVSEETIFRAGLFRYLRTRFPRWAAFLLPAVIFAAGHGNLASFVPLIVLALIFSLAYERTGTVITCMVAHGLFNLHSIAEAYFGIGQ